MANPYIDEIGAKRWVTNGRHHRTDGPAIEYICGTKHWYMDGLLHRTDGPAIEYSAGGRSWWLYGKVRTFNEWLNLNPDLTDDEKLMMKLTHG
jgi:hypothetical protein